MSIWILGGAHIIIPLRPAVSPNAKLMHSKLREKAPPPSPGYQIHSSQHLNNYAKTLGLGSSSCRAAMFSGIFSFLIANACNIYLLSLVGAWVSSLFPSLCFLFLFSSRAHPPPSAPGARLGRRELELEMSQHPLPAGSRFSRPPRPGRILVSPALGRKGNFQNKLHNPVGSGCAGEYTDLVCITHFREIR